MTGVDHTSVGRWHFEPRPEPSVDGRIPELEFPCRISDECDNGRGYPHHNLLGKHPIRIVRIVRHAFYGPPPNGLYRSHPRERKRCIEATHLAYGTPKQNASRTPPDVPGEAARKANAKLTPSQRSRAGLSGAYEHQRKHGKPSTVKAAQAGARGSAESVCSKRVPVSLQRFSF